MSKVSIPQVEFYITNVCNLTCDQCNRFNNYKFKGYQRWNDVKDTYARWGKLINIGKKVVIGGEPLLNPDIIDWCQGLDKIWSAPNHGSEIITNGYRLNKVDGLYELVKTGVIYLTVTLHNVNEKEFIWNEIKTFLPGPLKIELVNDPTEIWKITDCNYRQTYLMVNDQFSESAVIQQPNGSLTLHQSDPAKAHEICCMAHNDTVHFINGKIYKCGPVALFEEFDQQYNLDIPVEDRKLLSTYKPLTVDNFESYHTEFFKSLANPIAQCKFCPEEHNMRKIYPLVKGA